ncbi:hypothetical protein Pelo_18569 [Pelomyxa schiedti]|nr:hypothetical protein Pelo_18569 [Pelomyxa schiedti]
MPKVWSALATVFCLASLTGAEGGTCTTYNITAKLPFTFHGDCDGTNQTFSSLVTNPCRIFTFTPTNSSKLLAHACDTNRSAQISVQDGCPTGTNVSSDGGTCKLSQAAQWNATAGVTYYIAVSVDPPFELVVTDNSLHCDEAIPTYDGFRYQGDTSTAGGVFPPCNGGEYSKGILFSWTPKNTDIGSVATISACDANFNTNILAWSTTSTTCSENSPACLSYLKGCYPISGSVGEYWGASVQFQVSEVTHYWFLVTGKSTQTVREGRVNVTFSVVPMSCDTINITSLPFTFEVNTTQFGYTNSMAKEYAVRGAIFRWHNPFSTISIVADTCSSDSVNIDSALKF